MTDASLVFPVPKSAQRYGIPKQFVVSFNGEAIIAGAWNRSTAKPRASQADLPDSATDVYTQLEQYFTYGLAVFRLPIRFSGTDLSCKIWQSVATIPFGARASYGEVARAVGRPGAHRAVARAMSLLDVALFVPAHRVVGADGKVRGADGDSIRVALLAFEAQKYS